MPAVKFEPFTVSVNCGPPSTAELGLRLVTLFSVIRNASRLTEKSRRNVVKLAPETTGPWSLIELKLQSAKVVPRVPGLVSS